MDDNKIIDDLTENIRNMLTYICNCDKMELKAAQQTGRDLSGNTVITFDLSLYVKGGEVDGTIKKK